MSFSDSIAISSRPIDQLPIDFDSGVDSHRYRFKKKKKANPIDNKR